MPLCLCASRTAHALELMSGQLSIPQSSVEGSWVRSVRLLKSTRYLRLAATPHQPPSNRTLNKTRATNFAFAGPASLGFRVQTFHIMRGRALSRLRPNTAQTRAFECRKGLQTWRLQQPVTVTLGGGRLTTVCMRMCVYIYIYIYIEYLLNLVVYTKCLSLYIYIYRSICVWISLDFLRLLYFQLSCRWPPKRSSHASASKGEGQKMSVLAVKA